MNQSFFHFSVIPAEAGIQSIQRVLDAGFVIPGPDPGSA
jgi:hypothetical protein